MVLDASLVG